MKIPHTVPNLILRAYTKDTSTRDAGKGGEEPKDSGRKYWNEYLQPSTLVEQCLELIIKDYTFLTTLTDEMNRRGFAKYEARKQHWENQMVEYHRKRQNYEKKIYEIQLEKAKRFKKLKAKKALNPFATDDDDDEETKFSGGLSRFKTLSVLQLQQLHLPKEPPPVEEFEPWKPILDRLADSDRVEVIDSLDIQEIPLPVAIRTIRDSHYWERASRERWPHVEKDDHGDSWQQTYMEKHLFDILERFHPFSDDLSILLEQVELVSGHVKQLTLVNMIPNCFGTIETRSKIFRPFVPDEELTGEDEGFAQAGYLRQAADIQNLQDGEHAEGDEILDIARARDNSHFDLKLIMGHLPFLKKVSLVYELQEIGMDWEDRYFDFTDKDVENLAKALILAPNIEQFELNRSRMTGPQCAVLVRDGLKNMKNLQNLNISYNNVGDVGAMAVADLIGNETKESGVNKIHTLTMARNHITTAGAKALAASLLNSQLMCLDLRLNYINDEGGIEFAQSLMKNKKLSIFNLAANRLTKDCCQIFGEMIQLNNTLRQLDLSCNDLNEGGSYILDGIRSNCKILKVNIRLSNTGFKNEQSIEAFLKKNQSKLPFSILDRDYVCPPHLVDSKIEI